MACGSSALFAILALMVLFLVAASYRKRKRSSPVGAAAAAVKANVEAIAAIVMDPGVDWANWKPHPIDRSDGVDWANWKPHPIDRSDGVDWANWKPYPIDKLPDDGVYPDGPAGIPGFDDDLAPNDDFRAVRAYLHDAEQNLIDVIEGLKLAEADVGDAPRVLGLYAQLDRLRAEDDLDDTPSARNERSLLEEQLTKEATEREEILLAELEAALDEKNDAIRQLQEARDTIENLRSTMRGMAGTSPLWSATPSPATPRALIRRIASDVQSESGTMTPQEHAAAEVDAALARMSHTIESIPVAPRRGRSSGLALEPAGATGSSPRVDALIRLRAAEMAKLDALPSGTPESRTAKRVVLDTLKRIDGDIAREREEGAMTPTVVVRNRISFGPLPEEE